MPEGITALEKLSTGLTSTVDEMGPLDLGSLVKPNSATAASSVARLHQRGRAVERRGVSTRRQARTG